VREIQSVLSDLPIEIFSANQVALPDVEETEATLEGNAVLKATTIAAATGMLTISDDTGLEVDALDGAPGVYSARYAGESATYDDNCQKLLDELAGVPGHLRGARFRTVVACATPDGLLFTVDGVCEGQISHARRGSAGFGYDPVFYVPALDRTYAEMDLAQKNEISHRGLALRAFKKRYAELL